MRPRLRPALRNTLSPTLGVSLREPVLAWLLRDHHWLIEGRAARIGALSFAVGFALPLVLPLVFPLSSSQLPLALVLIVVGVRVILDTATMARSWGRLGLEYRTGRWDLVRLTAQSEGALLRAYYAAAYASIWRLLMAALGAQTAAALIGMLSASEMAARSSEEPVGAQMALLIGLALFSVDLLARPRALAALGLALSANAPRAGSAAVLGSVALLLFWAAQLAVLFTLSTLVGFAGSFAVLWLGNSEVWVLLAYTVLLAPLAVDWFVQRAALYRLAAAVAERDSVV